MTRSPELTAAIFISLIGATSALTVACDAPEVILREPTLVKGAGPTSAGPRAKQLEQVEARRAELEGSENPVGILVALGNLYYENGRYPEAIDWYRQGIEKAQPTLDTLDDLIRNELEAGADPYTGELPEICRGKADAQSFQRAVNVAEGLARQGPRGRALACYRLALAPVAGAFARRGSSWAVLEQTDRGMGELDRALEILPDDPESLFLYGAVVFNNRRAPGADFSEKAAKAWSRFLEVAPDHPRAAQVRGAMNSMKSRGGLPAGHPPTGEAAAASAAKDAPEMVPSGELAHALVAGLPPALAAAVRMLRSGDAGAAIAICDQFLAVAPQHGAALALKAQALTAAGRGADGAKEIAKAALAVGPNARAEHVLGMLHEQGDGDLEAAKTHYRSAQEMDPAYTAAAGVDDRLARLEAGN